jgi:hypothetical protein
MWQDQTDCHLQIYTYPAIQVFTMWNITPTEVYTVISYTYTLSPLQGLVISMQDKSYNVLKQVSLAAREKSEQKWS